MTNKSRKTKLIKRQIQQQVRRDLKKKKPIKKVTKIGSGLRMLGQMAGSYFGAPALGRSIGAGVSKIFGQGSYTTIGSMSGDITPVFGDITDGFRFKKKEFIGNILSSTDFKSSTYMLNPGDKTTFPWLSTIAANFEEYSFKGLIFHLKTTSGTAIGSTNTALGMWGAVTQYDPSNPDFSNKIQAESYAGVSNAIVCNSVIHPVECKPGSNVLRDKMYTRIGDLANGEDLKMYDWGKTQIFTAGSQAAAVIGELWVSYDVVFYKPKLPDGGTLAQSDAHIGSNVETTSPLGTIRSAVVGNNLGTTISSKQVLFPEAVPIGAYLVTLDWTSSPNVSMTAISHSLSGSLSDPGNLLLNAVTPGAGVSTGKFTKIITVYKSAPSSGVISFSGFPTISGSASVVVSVTQLGAIWNPTSLTKGLTNLEVCDLRNLMTLFNKLRSRVAKKKAKTLETAPPVLEELSESDIFELE